MLAIMQQTFVSTCCQQLCGCCVLNKPAGRGLGLAEEGAYQLGQGRTGNPNELIRCLLLLVLIYSTFTEC